MLLLVGLGNPGPNSLNNRHNIGFKIIDAINVKFKLSKQKPKFKGLLTTGNIVEQKLHTRGLHTTLLDGDNVRHGLNRDLGFTEADRVENIRRAGEVAKLMLESGLMTLVSFISPFRSERRLVRDMVDQDEFIEVFVDTPLSVCETRDPKGLYSKARAGEIKNFTGLDSPYEAPEHPEIVVNTIETTPDQAADIIIKYLEDNGFIKN